MLPTYQEIKEKLKAPFPKGTVEVNNRKAHIPVQAYINRLEEAAGEHWSWKTNDQPFIYEKECQIQVKGTLTILQAEREGVGFSNFKVYEDEERKIQNLKYAVLAAESDALRNACNKYQMGWSDLAQYKDWGKNPGVGITGVSSEAPQPITGFTCVKCGKPLLPSDIRALEEYQIRMKFCLEDIPVHLRKKRT